MNWLSSVAKHHKEYIKYINKMGSTSHPEDLVQEMYLRLNKYKDAIIFNKDGTVPKSYIYRILFNMLIDYKKSSTKFHFEQVDVLQECAGQYDDVSQVYKQYAYEEINLAKHEAFDRIVEGTLEEMDNLDEPNKYPYNKELLSLYISSGMSMRAISALTGISLTSIHWTIKNCREQLSEELSEDIEDYINQDYERI
jgi:RNA polymerase sigma factor (sigma-70 family)